MLVRFRARAPPQSVTTPPPQFGPGFAQLVLVRYRHTPACSLPPLRLRLLSLLLLRESIRQHTSAYVSIRQHTSAYVSIAVSSRSSC